MRRACRAANVRYGPAPSTCHSARVVVFGVSFDYTARALLQLTSVASSLRRECPRRASAFRPVLTSCAGPSVIAGGPRGARRASTVLQHGDPQARSAGGGRGHSCCGRRVGGAAGVCGRERTPHKAPVGGCWSAACWTHRAAGSASARRLRRADHRRCARHTRSREAHALRASQALTLRCALSRGRDRLGRCAGRLHARPAHRPGGG